MSNETGICVFNQETLGRQYTSFKVSSVAERKALYNSINAPDFRLAEFINKRIDLRDAVVEAVVLTGDKFDKTPSQWSAATEDREAFRVILIDKEGKTYTATSSGIYNSVRNIYNIFGTLHFDEPMLCEINQVSTKNGNTLTIALVD